jgi:hypothetical protein
MERKNRMRIYGKTFFKYSPCLWLLISAIAFVACSQPVVEWTEEVLLESGEIVLVKRTAKPSVLGEIGGPGGWENEGMTVQLLRPRKPDDPQTWDARYLLLLFDRDPISKEWFMVATFITCTSWYELGRPKLPYTEFWFRDGRWVQQPLSPRFIGRQANMLTRIHSDREKNHTIASKQAINSDPAIAPEYTRVVDHWSTGC